MKKALAAILFLLGFVSVSKAQFTVSVSPNPAVADSGSITFAISITPVPAANRSGSCQFMYNGSGAPTPTASNQGFTYDGYGNGSFTVPVFNFSSGSWTVTCTDFSTFQTASAVFQIDALSCSADADTSTIAQNNTPYQITWTLDADVPNATSKTSPGQATATGTGSATSYYDCSGNPISVTATAPTKSSLLQIDSDDGSQVQYWWNLTSYSVNPGPGCGASCPNGVTGASVVAQPAQKFTFYGYCNP